MIWHDSFLVACLLSSFGIVVALKAGDDRRKQAVIIGVGTVITALVAFSPFRIRIEPIYTPTPPSQEKPAPIQPAALPAPPTETPFPTQPVAVVPTATASQFPSSSGADRWACIHEADSTGKSTWETCWRYVRIDGSGGVSEALKESATAIEWIGPTDLTYTTIGQYHIDYMSEWYVWAAQRKEVRFCIDVNSEVEVEGGVERITAGCYAWRRGPFMVRIP